MDLSKLPRLSETDKHAPPPQPEAKLPPQPARQADFAYAQPVSAGGGEAWFSIVIGVIVQLMNTRFWSFVGSRLFGSEFPYSGTDETGAPMAYTASVFFTGDLAMVLFGLVLILEGAVISFSRKGSLVMVAFALTVFATLFNLYYVVSMMNKGYGLQLMSALAVAFGGYIAMYEWRLIQTMRLGRA